LVRFATSPTKETAMVDVLEELAGDTLARAEVERRVDDWARRIDDLYAQIASWLTTGWTVAANRRVTQMHEEPMRRVGLPPRDLPVLDLLHNGQRAATIEPRGLWIIGANGRLDLRRGAAHYLIIDAAENFEPPQWRLAALKNRQSSRPLDQNALRDVL